MPPNLKKKYIYFKMFYFVTMKTKTTRKFWNSRCYLESNSFFFNLLTYYFTLLPLHFLLQIVKIRAFYFLQTKQIISKKCREVKASFQQNSRIKRKLQFCHLRKGNFPFFLFHFFLIWQQMALVIWRGVHDLKKQDRFRICFKIALGPITHFPRSFVILCFCVLCFYPC